MHGIIVQCTRHCQGKGSEAESKPAMKKDTQITFRVPSDLKARLQDIAAVEGRSMAQICEAFLRAGSESYKKQGAKFLHRFIGPGQQGNLSG